MNRHRLPLILALLLIASSAHSQQFYKTDDGQWVESKCPPYINGGNGPHIPTAKERAELYKNAEHVYEKDITGGRIGAVRPAGCRIDPNTGQIVCDRPQPQQYYQQQYQQQTTPHPSRCRIHIDERPQRMPDGTIVEPKSVGSGMLVDNKTGLIITCGHLFRDSQQGITCTFPNGRRFEARFVAADHNADLAAIRIRPTDIETLPINTAEQSGTLTAGGFGGDGRFAAATGRVVETVRSTGGATSQVISAPVRQGDSGGGVVNADRQFVGVVWGCDDSGQAYVTCGRPLARFLDEVFPHRTGAIIPRATPRSYGSPGGQYAGQQPGYYGQPEPYQPPLQPVQPYNPPIADVDPSPYEDDEPDIDWEAWEELQDEQEAIAEKQAQMQQQIQSLVVKVDGIAVEGKQGPPGPKGPKGDPGQTPEIDYEELAGNIHVENKPFSIRVRNPQTGRVTPYAKVLPGQFVTIDLTPIEAQQQ